MTIATEVAVRTHEFRAMGCGIVLTAAGAREADVVAGFAGACAHAAAWEQRFSRFRPDSELQRLNAAAGAGPVAVDPALLDLVIQAVAASRATGGRFDPLLGRAVVAAGYDRDFAAVAARAPSAAVNPAAAGPGSGIDAVAIDEARGTIALPAGTALDLGGIAKGAWVDAIVAHLRDRWPAGCVDAGGDLRVWGPSPDGDEWLIGVEHPLAPDLDIAVLGLRDSGRGGAVATSGRNSRRWATHAGEAHHLIDPATGRPTPGGPLTVTVVAATAVAAEIAAKALFLSVARGEAPLLPGAALGIVVDEDGRGVIVEGGDADVCTVYPAIVVDAG